MPGLTNPGIISLNVNGRMLTTHYRPELFADGGNVAIGSGDLSLSQGFMGSFAADLLLGNSYSFDLGGAVDLTMTADVDELLLLAQALEDEGLSVGDLFGTSADIEIVIDESDPAKLALLADLNPELADLVTAVMVPGGGTFYLPISIYSDALDLSGYDGIVAVGSADEVTDFSTQGSGVFDIPDEVLDLVEEYQVVSGTLFLPATEFLTQGPAYTLVGSADEFVNGFIQGDIAEFSDGSFDAASRIDDSSGFAQAFIDVYDDAATITLDGGELGTLVDGFPTRYIHQIGDGDVVTSFTGNQDFFWIQPDAFTPGAMVNILNDFDAGLDFLDISLQTDVFSDDDDGGFDFAFIGFDQILGSRTVSAIADKSPVDIRITEASTHIEFDGLTGPYDGTADFEIILSNNVAATLHTDFIRGLPAIDRISEADFNNTILLPLAELQRFQSLELVLTNAPDAYDFVDILYNGAPDARQLEVTRVSNPEGDVILGTAAAELLVGDSLGPAFDDVIFGGAGDDGLVGGAGADWLDGGAGNDVLFAQGARLLNGGEGDDTLTLEDGVFASPEYIELIGGDGADTLLVSAGADLTAVDDIEISGRTFDGGPDGDDLITINGLLTSDEDIEIYGNEGADTITIAAGAMLFAEFCIEVYGQQGDAGADGNDVITIAGMLTSNDEEIDIEGNAGNDVLDITATAELLAEYSVDLEGSAGDDTVTVAGTVTSNNSDIYISGDGGMDTILIAASAVLTADDDIEVYGFDGGLGVDGNDLITIAGLLTSVGDEINVEGNAGDDTILIEPTAEFSADYSIDILGNDGIDTITVGGLLTTFDDNISIEGNAGMDTITISGALSSLDDDVSILGNEGADSITIAPGTEIIAHDDLDVYGFNGDPGIDGGDLIIIAGALTTLTGDLDIEGNDGDDTILIDPTALLVGAYDLDIEGNAGDDIIDISGTLTALDNDLLITGGGAADWIQVAAGAVLASVEDVEIVGDEGLTPDGADTIEVYGVVLGQDEFEVRGGGGNDTIMLDGAFSATDSGDISDGNDDEDIRIEGGFGDDIIQLDGVFTAADDIKIDGGSGNDTITLAGSYTILGDPYNSDDEEDRLVNEFSVDGGEGNDTIDASTLTDSLILMGDFAADTIMGGAGDDTLEGGQGADLLSGGDGADIFSYFSRGGLGDEITDFSTVEGDLIGLGLDLITDFSATSSLTPLWRSFTNSFIASNTNTTLFLRVLTEGDAQVAWVVSTSSGTTVGTPSQSLVLASTLRAESSSLLPTSALFKGVAGSGGHIVAFRQMLTDVFAPSRRTTSQTTTEFFSHYSAVQTTGRYLAFALISNTAGTDTRLMVAFIVNGTNGLGYGGTGTTYTTANTFDEITKNEIATIATIAQVNGVDALPANLHIGELILI